MKFIEKKTNYLLGFVAKMTFIGLFALIGLLLFVVLYDVTIRSQLRYENSISSLLGLKNVDAEYVDKARSWMIDYEVYKLSDQNVKNFLENPDKNFPDRMDYQRFDWTRASLDSLITTTPLSYFGGLKKSYSDTINRLYYDDSYYALHYKGEDMMILYILDEKNKLLYITDYWI